MNPEQYVEVANALLKTKRPISVKQLSLKTDVATCEVMRFVNVLEKQGLVVANGDFSSISVTTKGRQPAV